tara:strand:+ start:246 stop:494 length:249 start_codon:yes stop_codon:yes gene_type:complete
MNTEELEQTTEEGNNRNTASLTGVLAGCQKDSAESLFPVQKTNTSSVSFVSLPNEEAQPCCAPTSERENSGFSIFTKKIGDE